MCFTPRFMPMVWTWERRGFPPEGAFGNDWRYFGLSQPWWERSWQLADRDQGCCGAPCNAWASTRPPNQSLREHEYVNGVESEQPWFIPSSTSHMCMHTRTPCPAHRRAHTYAHPHVPWAHGGNSVCGSKTCWAPGWGHAGETHTGLRWDTLHVGDLTISAQSPHLEIAAASYPALVPPENIGSLAADGLSLSHSLCGQIGLRPQHLWLWETHSGLVLSGLAYDLPNSSGSQDRQGEVFVCSFIKGVKGGKQK